MSKDDYAKGIIKSVDVDKVLKLLDGKGTGTDKIFYERFIKPKKAIQWGALGDPFCNFERNRGTALPILKKMNELQLPVSFSTKGTWFVNDERYMSIFREHPENWHFKFSIITSNAEKAKIVERAVDSPQERFKAMKKLSDMGIATTLRLRPFFIGLSDLDLEETIRNAKEAGAISVSTEFFCLDIRASFTLKERYKELSRVLGYDIWKFYKKHSRAKGYLRLNRTLKRPYMEKLQELCKKYELKLYVSDPDFKEVSCHGSCCGIPQRPPFNNYCKSQLCELLCFMRDNKKETISWSEYYELFKEDFKWQEEVPSACPHNFGDTQNARKHKNESCLEYARNAWNNPKSEKSPFKYFNGLLEPQGLDKNKDIIYRLKKQ
jgi:DNA repair photolyase